MPWRIDSGPEQVAPYADHSRYRYVLRRGGEERDVFVEVSNTATATQPATLPSPLDEVVRTRARSIVAANLDRHEPPIRIVVYTGGWHLVPRDGSYEHGDRVHVRDGDAWVEARFLRPGDPDEAITVNDPRVEGGRRRADVAWVERADDDTIAAYPYAAIRGEPPAR